MPVNVLDWIVGGVAGLLVIWVMPLQFRKLLALIAVTSLPTVTVLNAEFSAKG